ncbi:MAG: hypothetical protein HY866_12025 [Chloroflexi bacterium]|nr:hypothetical protein [Chloroflexota bacterium]
MNSNRKLLGIVVIVVTAVVAVFALTGIPYGHFSWSGLVAAQDDSAYEGAAEPGCQVDIPDGSVVGSFLSDTQLFWAPDAESASIEYNIGATPALPKTAWVIGQDASESFYKIVWVCQYLWVPVSTMGPNYDAVWQGTPLPTRIVK